MTKLISNLNFKLIVFLIFCVYNCNFQNITTNITVSVGSTTSLSPLTTITTVKPKVSQEQWKIVCPSKESRVPFLSLPCKSSKECKQWGSNLLCCNSRCIRGVALLNPEPSHSPVFGVIDRVCPINPMPELLNVQECLTDEDCGPRICCQEKNLKTGEIKSYCRNGAPRFNKMPIVRQLLLPLKTFAGYLQCSPSPPPFLDLFPKPCESPFDCFPNLCCQENGKKYCRPPKSRL